MHWRWNNRNTENNTPEIPEDEHQAVGVATHDSRKEDEGMVNIAQLPVRDPRRKRFMTGLAHFAGVKGGADAIDPDPMVNVANLPENDPKRQNYFSDLQHFIDNS